jgi:hypothetical protein
MAFFCHHSIFLCTAKCPGLCPWGYTYPRLGITALQYVLNKTGHLLLEDDAECYQSDTTC